MLELLEGRRIVVCAGAGGVGKTTTAAAIAMGMAERGLKVAVVTIDPARRLADSLGLEQLGNEPRLVDGQFEGELWALMLDSKRTFDALIERLAPDEATRDEVLSNRIYQQLSNARSPARRSSPRSPSSTSSTRRVSTTCSCSTRRPRATRSTSSTRRAG